MMLLSMCLLLPTNYCYHPAGDGVDVVILNWDALTPEERRKLQSQYCRVAKQLYDALFHVVQMQHDVSENTLQAAISK